MARLEGKVIIVTGGNSGVGEATALLLASEGAKLIISARREAQLQAVAEKIRAAGGEVLPVVCDISKPEDAKRLVETAVSTYGKLDVMVNNAGVLEAGLKPIDRVEDADMEKVIAINEKGTMYCMREAAKVMREANSGSIVNVASIAGVMGCGGAAYVATKAAIVGLTRHTALRFAGTGVRCNAICPGNIITPMTMGSNPAELDPDMMGQMYKHADLRIRSCQAEDVAKVILFFASDDSAPITGQAIITDFGANL